MILRFSQRSAEPIVKIEFYINQVLGDIVNKLFTLTPNKVVYCASLIEDINNSNKDILLLEVYELNHKKEKDSLYLNPTDLWINEEKYVFINIFDLKDNIVGLDTDVTNSHGWCVDYIETNNLHYTVGSNKVDITNENFPKISLVFHLNNLKPYLNNTMSDLDTLLERSGI